MKSIFDRTLKWGASFLRSLSQNIAVLTPTVTSLTQNWVYGGLGDFSNFPPPRKSFPHMHFSLEKSNVFTIQPVIQSVLQKSISNFKMFIFKKYENKPKQNFQSCKNISLPSFGSIYWQNILGHCLIIIELVIPVNS